MKKLWKFLMITGLLLLMAGTVTACGREKAGSDTQAAEAGGSKAVEGTTTKSQDIESGEDSAALPSGHTADKIVIGFVDVTGTGLISDTLGVARDKGFIKEELDAIGVEAEFVAMTGAGPAINEALASNNLDVGFLGDVPAIIGRASGIETQIISFSGLNNGASLAVQKDSGITSVNDLKGRKIATQKGAYMHKVLIDILKDSGLSEKDIEFVNMNAQGSAEAFITGNVDGVVVGGSTLTNIIENGYGDVLVDYREHPEWNCGGYGIARTGYIEENPDIIKALLRALVRAQKTAIEDGSVLSEQWVGTGNTESSYEYLYPKHDNYYDIRKTDANVASGKDTLQFLLDNQLVTDGFNFEGWINSSFYEAAYKELGE